MQPKAFRTFQTQSKYVCVFMHDIFCDRLMCGHNGCEGLINDEDPFVTFGTFFQVKKHLESNFNQ